MPKLDEVKWREFSLNDLFTTIQRGKRLTKNNQVEGDQPYVSSTMNSNGIDCFVGNHENVRVFENCLTIANSGSVGSVFYQGYSFVASDHVTALINKDLSPYHYQFIATCLTSIGEKYSFNREINDKRIRREKILLPIEEEGRINFNFMERYIKTKTQQAKKSIFVSGKHEDIVDFRELNEIEWGEFKIGELFAVEKGIYLPTVSKIAGNTPYVTAKQGNNGVDDFIGNKKLFPKNSITVEKIGFKAYYQEHDFYCTHDVTVLENDKMNKYSGQFLATSISNQGSKYSYARQAQKNVTKATSILLPLNKANGPDWNFMEQFMKRQENKILDKVRSFFK